MMHPQLGYPLARDKDGELERGARKPRSAVAEGPPASTSPKTLCGALHEIGRAVNVMDTKALHEDAGPLVHRLVEGVLQASKEAGLVDLPNGPRPGEPVVVGYQTLAKIGSRISTRSEVALGLEPARQIDSAISDLRALGRPDEGEPLDQRRYTSIARRTGTGRILRLFGRRVTRSSNG